MFATNNSPIEPFKTDQQQARKHLNYLGYEAGENVYLRYFFHGEDPRKNNDKGRKQDRLRWKDVENLQQEGRGVYVVVNGAGGGHEDKDIKQCAAIFCEWDNIPVEEQLLHWETVGFLEPTFTVFSGDKSMQPYWVFDTPIGVEQWRELQRLLIEVMSADPCNKNSSRLFRLAGGWHIKPGREPVRSEFVQESGKKYSPQQLLEKFKEIREKQHSRLSGQAPNVFVFNYEDITIPVPEPVPLELCLSKKSRHLLQLGAAAGTRSDSGYILAADLIGAADYLQSVGQCFDGDTWQLFLDYCRRCPSGEGWAEGEWKSIWESTKKNNPTPSCQAEGVENCIRAWYWKHHVKTGKSSGSSNISILNRNDERKGEGDRNPNVSNVSLRDRIQEILDRTESQAERKAAFISLASSIKLPLRELEQLADLIASESELSEGRQERKKELDRLFKISARRLTLPRYLHPNLAHPFEKIANWMGIDVESLLTIMLPASASLLNPQTRVIVKESIDFLEPLIFYAGIVSESGNRKSPIFKIITKALRKLQNEEDSRYNQAHLKYQEQLRAWKKTKPEERDESPEPPPPPREFYLDNFTSEALDKIKSQQPQHGILIRKDELSSLFNSYNSYRGGKGGDREGILSGWNGDGIKVNRANGSRLSLSQDASSIAGAIQPNKLRQIMGGLEDEQGEWARFLWFLAPLKAFRLPQGDTKFEMGDLLEGIYRKLDSLPPKQYKFSPEGQQIYEDYHWLLERRKLAEPRQGMRSAIAKMQGYCARFAGLLHILWEVAAGQGPGETIPSERVEAATALAEFYLGQVRLIHSDGEADSGELNPLLKKILEKAKQLNGITARVAKQSIKALKGTTPQKVREYLNELVAMGYGFIEGQGNRCKFIPKTVDPSVDPTKNGETLINQSFSPNVDSNCRPTVDPTVDLIKNSKSYGNKGLQPNVDSNCRPVDQILHSVENSVSNSIAISTSSNVVSSNTLNDGLQVYSLAESFSGTSVETVDPGSTVRSTVDSGSTVDFENPDYWDDETNGSGGSTVVDLKPQPGGGGADAIPAEEKSPDKVTTTDNIVVTESENQKLSVGIESDRALVHLVEEDDKPRLVLDESKLDLHRARGFELGTWKPTLQVKPYERLQRAIVDIETFGLNPDTDRIIAIGLKMGDQVAIVSDRNEAAMLKEFNNLLVKWQPDVLSGHNIMNFDCPFIAKRCAQHGIKSPFRISDRESCLRATRVNGKPITYREVYACNRKINLIDTYHLIALFDYSARQLSNLKLKSAVLELGLRKEARLELSAEEIKQDWTSGNFQTIEKYLKLDLEDTELLMDAFLPQIHYQALIVPGMSLQQLVLRGNRAVGK